MGSHSYLQNLNSCAGLPASVRVHMQCSDTLMELGDAYVKNAQLQGQTNFRNQYGHGNTQVDNLAGLPGSVQNFGLQELLLGANGHGIWQGAALQELPSHNRYVKFLQNLDAATQWWLIPNAEGVLEIVNVDMTTEEGQEKQAILIPDVPESSGARPWTQTSWNQWNLLEHNGTAHPDRPFSKQFGFEPFLIM